jgi:hypothetical protein
MAKYDNFKRGKLEICPNPPKILAISEEESWKSAQILPKSWQFHYFSSLKCDDSLRKFPKISFDSVVW